MTNTELIKLRSQVVCRICMLDIFPKTGAGLQKLQAGKMAASMDEAQLKQFLVDNPL